MISNKPGQHIIIDCYECDSLILSNHSSIGVSALCQDILISCGCKILSHVEHAFDEGGYTIVYVLAESHFSVHTWPEYHYCAIDLFSCAHRDSSKIDSIVSRLTTLFVSGNYQFYLVERGHILL